MGKIQLLDCTLRDGGYVNDWQFGQKNLVSVFERLVDTGVEFVEIGFLDERRPFDIDRSIMPDTSCAGKIFDGIDKKHVLVLGMIDYGTCNIENIQPCRDSFLDGIRVIFKKHLTHPAMEYCRRVKALGYKVFAQLVSITSYNDEELLELVGLVNNVQPYAVSMVDTYGLLHPEDLLHYYRILDAHVDTTVQIGFHAHNNFQLAYANTLAFIEEKGKHDIVVDGTLYGMGKSAGNAPLELLAMRLNQKFGKTYHIEPMLESTKESLMEIYEKSPWGYNTSFYMCAANRCHPNYVTFFESKQNLSLSKIDKLLALIEPEDKKLLYDKEIAETLYVEYLSGTGDDTDSKYRFRLELADKKILIVGPGKNTLLQRRKIQQFVETEKPYVISINYIPDAVGVHCVFVTNGTRYHDMTLPMKKDKNSGIKLLATSNVECKNGMFDFEVNRAPLLETKEKIMDNSFLMLVKLLRSIGIRKIYCAGFDGYSDKEDNYCNSSMEYQFVKQEASHLNYHMKEMIAEFRRDMSIQFITYSAYDAVEDINGAAI